MPSIDPTQPAGAGRDAAARPGAVIVVLNLPVPDDHRVWAQAQTLKAAGAQVAVVCPAIRSALPGTRDVDGITVTYFRSFEGKGILGTVVEGLWTTFISSRGARRALSGMSGAPARSIQVCNPPDSLFRLLRWARRRGVKTIYDQHDVVPVLAASKASFQRLAGIFQSFERRTVEAADEILTPSEEQVARIQKVYGRTATVVRTAAVPAQGGPRRARADGEQTVIGYLGVIGEQDGLGDLVEAVNSLRGNRITGFRVEIAGDGPALPGIRRRVDELGLGELITLRGWVGRGEVSGFLDGIDVMVVPDPDIEFNHYCAMNKVTHAMARGIPVVLRPLRENARVAGEGGILAKDMSLPAFVDAIASFLDMPADERSAHGAQLYADFDKRLSWDGSSPGYLAAFGLAEARSAEQVSG
ncbi:MAG TPA: glycosyltransferase [Actinocrinis sp.]|nr:glycosyltransferase [Actinocrinis sp.]